MNVHLSVRFVYGSPANLYYFIEVNVNQFYGSLITVTTSVSDVSLSCLFPQVEKGKEGKTYLQRYHSTRPPDHIILYSIAGLFFPQS